MNNNERYIFKLLKSAERQKRFYDRNRDEILKKKKIERAQLKIINSPILEIKKSTEYSLDMIINVLKGIMSINTQKKYINDVKRVFVLSGIEIFTGTMEEFNIIKKRIEESKYSLSTQKGSVQSLLIFIDMSDFFMDSKVKAKYEVLYDVLKIRTEDEHTEKQNNVDNNVMDFEKYLNLVLEKFGEKSKEYLIAKMYYEITVRDNLYNLKIVDSLDEDDGISNFLTNDCKHIILNDYKTKNIYDKKTFVLSDELQKLLLNYIDANKLKIRLFPEHKNGLSHFIISMNRKINVKGGINEIRKMSVSQFLMKENLTAEERLEFAGKMCHREQTQQKYRRGII